MNRGLAFEIPFGPIYQETTARRLHKNLPRLGLSNIRFKKGNLDKSINDAIMRIMDGRFLPLLQNTRPGFLRQYRIRSGDLLNSYGFAIFHNGQYQKTYVRTIDETWQSETDKKSANHTDLGTPQDALISFAKNYVCHTKYGFSVVIMVGYPYSVNLEEGKDEGGKEIRKLWVLYPIAYALYKDLQANVMPKDYTSHIVYTKIE